jgi:hypothetical protein
LHGEQQVARRRNIMKLSNPTAKLTSIAQATTHPTTMLRAVAAATLAAAVLALAPSAHAQRFGVAVRLGGFVAPPAPLVLAPNPGYYIGPEPYAPPIIVHDRFDNDRFDHRFDRRDFNQNRDRHDFHR